MTQPEGFVNVTQLGLARKYLDMTQSDVSKALELNITNYGYIEKGKSDPKWSNLKKIIDFFESNGIVFLKDGSVIKKNK